MYTRSSCVADFHFQKVLVGKTWYLIWILNIYLRGSRKQHIVDMTAARRANKQPVVYSVPAARLTLPSNMIHTLRIREIPAGDISTEITPPPPERKLETGTNPHS